METELYLRCTCGDEVLVIENYREEKEFIFSIRTIPIKMTWRTQLRKLWQTLKDGFGYEVILNEEQMNVLQKWISTNTEEDTQA